jgi:hypothetical protein
VWTKVIHIAQSPCIRLLAPQPGEITHCCFFPITLGKIENRCGAEARAAATSSEFGGLLLAGTRVFFTLPLAALIVSAPTTTRIKTAANDLRPITTSWLEVKSVRPVPAEIARSGVIPKHWPSPRV